MFGEKYFMKLNHLKAMMMITACAVALVLVPAKAEAAALSEVVTAGVATTMEKTDDENVLAEAVASSAVEGYTVLGVVDVEKGYINIRENAGTDYEIVGKIAADGICEIISMEEEWSQISSGNVEGYISNDYLLTGADANKRAAELQENGAELKTALTITEYRYGEGVTDIQMEVCEFARQFTGNPYRWGGTSLTKGADCSGFTLSVYKNFGISLPHSSSAQSHSGSRVDISEVQPGDLIFYGGSNIHHVALYIGNGQVVHAKSKDTGIVISGMYYHTPTKAVRLV